MTKIEKLVGKLLKEGDFTWKELVKVLNFYGYYQIKNKGKTTGSRRKFSNKNKDIINLHEPHPQPIVKEYIIKQVVQKLKLKKK